MGNLHACISPHLSLLSLHTSVSFHLPLINVFYSALFLQTQSYTMLFKVIWTVVLAASWIEMWEKKNQTTSMRFELNSMALANLVQIWMWGHKTLKEKPIFFLFSNLFHWCVEGLQHSKLHSRLAIWIKV